MPEFSGNDVVELGEGVTVRAVDVAGQVEMARATPQAGTPVRDAEPGAPAELLTASGTPVETATAVGAAMAGSGMRVHTVVEFPALTPPSAPAPGGTRAAGDGPHLELAVEAPVTDDEGQLVLEVDGIGYMRWHMPQPGPAPAEGSTRALPTQRFVIPVAAPPRAVRQEVRDRSLFGLLIRKTLHVIRFPVEKAAGAVAHGLAQWWENQHRPHRLHLVNVDGSRGPTVDTAWFAQPDLGRSLVLVHGTFSTGQSSFSGLSQDFRRLHDLYGGRVVVFDHPTIHVSPQDNARWLAKQLPTDRRLAFDLLAHSRGGLVAREIGRTLPAGSVNRMVQVASPNAGTALCSPQRIGLLLEVVTNLAGFLPESPVSAVLEATLELVKQVSIGAFRGLPGLTAMDPDGAALAELNKADAPGFACHAIVTDYEPAASASLVEKTLDVTVDLVFGAANDLVVPTEGMSRAGRFSVGDPFHATAGAGERSVAHTSYFGAAGVRAEIARCLGLATRG